MFLGFQSHLGLKNDELTLNTASFDLWSNGPKEKCRQDGGVLCMIYLLSSVENVAEWLEVRLFNLHVEISCFNFFY